MKIDEAEKLLRGLLKGEFSSLTIGFNEVSACNYMTAKQWSEEVGGEIQDYNDLRNWVSAEEREKALANNSVWSCQWYPETPVGFCILHASSLSALIKGLSDA